MVRAVREERDRERERESEEKESAERRARYAKRCFSNVLRLRKAH